MNRRYFSARELTAAIGASPATIREWVRRGLVPAARAGDKGRLRFDLAAVRKAIEAKGGRPAGQPGNAA
jgi:DNA-binding transcriptional MerR regulator